MIAFVVDIACVAVIIGMVLAYYFVRADKYNATEDDIKNVPSFHIKHFQDVSNDKEKTYLKELLENKII